MIDPVEFGKAMGAIVREATAPLISRIEELEKAQLERPAVEEVAAAAAALVPVPEGVDLDVLKAYLAELVKAIPEPAPGQSVSADDVRPMLEELVGAAVKALPPAAPGKDADMDALHAALGDLVKAIPLPAVPSVEEVAGAFERRFSDLTLAWERQARDTFDKAADRMPVPKDGRDALALESFELLLADDGRTVTVKMQAGEVVVEKSLRIAAVIDRGVFVADRPYEQGDGTTYGGSFWIAQKDCPAGAPGGSPDWRLAVKKGRDGKDLRDSASLHDPSKGVSIK